MSKVRRGISEVENLKEREKSFEQRQIEKFKPHRSFRLIVEFFGKYWDKAYENPTREGDLSLTSAAEIVDEYLSSQEETLLSDSFYTKNTRKLLLRILVDLDKIDCFLEERMSHAQKAALTGMQVSILRLSAYMHIVNQERKQRHSSENSSNKRSSSSGHGYRVSPAMHLCKSFFENSFDNVYRVLERFEPCTFEIYRYSEMMESERLAAPKSLTPRAQVAKVGGVMASFAQTVVPVAIPIQPKMNPYGNQYGQNLGTVGGQNMLYGGHAPNLSKKSKKRKKDSKKAKKAKKRSSVSRSESVSSWDGSEDEIKPPAALVQQLQNEAASSNLGTAIGTQSQPKVMTQLGSQKDKTLTPLENASDDIISEADRIKQHQENFKKKTLFGQLQNISLIKAKTADRMEVLQSQAKVAEKKNVVKRGMGTQTEMSLDIYDKRIKVVVGLGDDFVSLRSAEEKDEERNLEREMGFRYGDGLKVGDGINENLVDLKVD